MRQYDSYRASQPAYVHGSAAPDLRRQGNPDVNVMPGRRNGVNHAGVPESIFGVVGVVFAVAIVIAIFACARVLLSAASVTTTIATDELSTQIANERTLGNDLEVQQSQLSNSTHIRSAAEGLGMASPAATESIELGADVVATDASGNLSLSGSLSSMASQG